MARPQMNAITNPTDCTFVRPVGEPVIEVLSAEKLFSDGTRALAPIDLAIHKGDFLTMIGPSGCGKSTLLSLMSGLSAPSDGRITWWRGGAASIGTAGHEIGIVFQDATLMPWATVETNVRLPLDLDGMPKPKSAAVVARSLDRVGLSPFAQYRPRQLSGGMRMRVSIARALAVDPDILLMDEPFGALDEFTRNKLDSDILAMWAERNLTIIFVTHSIYEAVFLSTRVVVMAARPGRIVREIKVNEPFPRGDEFRVSVRFAKLCAELSAALADASCESGEQL